MSIQIVNASIAPNPVTTAGKYQLIVELHEQADPYLVWQEAGGARLVDKSGRELLVARGASSGASYVSRYTGEKISSTLTAFRTAFGLF